MALKELLVSFGVEVDAKALTGVEGKITGLMSGLKKLGGLLIGGAVVKGIGSFIKNQVDFADNLQTTADKLGVSADELQRFHFAADKLDVPIDSATNALKFLNKNLGEAANGNATAAESFRQLGVETKNSDGSLRSSVDIMGDAADSFASMADQGKKTALAMKLFGKGGVDMIPMLNSGGAAVRELMGGVDDLGGTMSADYMKSVNDADNAMKDFGYASNLAKSKITQALLPAFTALVKYAVKLTGTFNKLVNEMGGLNRIFAVFGLMIGAFMIVKLNNLIRTAGGVGKAMKSAFGLGIKEMLVIGSIILLALVLEDLFTFIKGGDSVIGDLFEKFMGHDEALKFAQQLRDVWSQLQDSFTEVGPLLATVMTQLGPVFAQALPYLVKGLEQVIKLVASAVALFGGLVGAIGAVASGKGLDGAMKAINSAGEAVFGKTVSEVDSKTGAVNTHNVGGLYGDAPAPVPNFAAGQMGPPVSNTVTQNNPVTIKVEGAGDPMATADAVAQKQQRVNTQANRDALGAVKVTG